jgi:hypothetical protein
MRYVAILASPFSAQFAYSIRVGHPESAASLFSLFIRGDLTGSYGRIEGSRLKIEG